MEVPPTKRSNTKTYHHWVSYTGRHEHQLHSPLKAHRTHSRSDRPSWVQKALVDLDTLHRRRRKLHLDRLVVWHRHQGMCGWCGVSSMSATHLLTRLWAADEAARKYAGYRHSVSRSGRQRPRPKRVAKIRGTWGGLPQEIMPCIR